MTRRTLVRFFVATLAVGAAVPGGLAQGKNPGGNTSASGSPAAAAARGRAVFHDRCAICHFSDSVAAKMGPGLKGIYGRGKFADGAKVDDASMQRRIENGSKNMPPFKPILKPGQIQDLLAYLKTL